MIMISFVVITIECSQVFTTFIALLKGESIGRLFVKHDTSNRNNTDFLQSLTIENGLS